MLRAVTLWEEVTQGDANAPHVLVWAVGPQVYVPEKASPHYTWRGYAFHCTSLKPP